MKRLIVKISLLLLMGTVQLSTNWLPNPEAIFGPDIEIISVNAHDISPTLQLTASPLPVIPTPTSPVLTYANFPAPLPKGYRWYSPIQPITSPDSQFIVLLGDVFREGSTVLLYTVATGHFDDLGFPGSLFRATWEWIDDSTLVFYGNDIHGGVIYSSQVTIVDIKHKYIDILPPSEFPTSPIYRREKARIEVFTRWHSTPPLCQWFIYDFNRHIPLHYDYMDLCDLEYGDWFDDGYFRVVSSDHKLATVIVYNPNSRAREELISGEIEHISWVKDGYAALMMDSSGYVDVLPDSSEASASYVASPVLSIIDLRTKQVVYSTKANWGGKISSWRPDVSFFRADWLQVYRTDLPPKSDKPQPNSLVHLEGSKATETVIDGMIETSLGNSWYILLPSGLYEFLTSIRLYNLESQQILDLVDVSALPSSSVDIHYIGANEFLVTLQQSSLHEAIYKIRVKGISITTS